MTSSDLRTVHILEVNTALSDGFQQAVPHLDIQRIPFKHFWEGPVAADVPNPEEIKVIVALDLHFARLLDAGVQLPNLIWVHTVTAGVEKIIKYYQKSKTTPHFVLTRSSISSDPVSEYAIGQILAHDRSLYMYHDQQKASVWKRTVGDSPGRSLVLHGSSVVLLGVGNIGRRMAALCNMFGMTVYGVTRTPLQKGHGSPDVHHYSTTEDLTNTLSQGDYIVNVLPSTQHTRGLLDNDVLQVCKDKKPVFINVGRGDIMNEESIIKALRSEWISAAVLDVFPVEPLPADSLLWKEPGVKITPHVAMALDEDTLQKAVSVFLENYNRFVSKKDLIDVVDIERGY